MRERTTKPTIRLVRPAKAQISLRIRAFWSLLIACTFYSLQAIQRGINDNPCYIGWIYRLTWVFASHLGLIVGFVMRWLRKWRLRKWTLEDMRTAKIQTSLRILGLIRIFAVRLHNIGILLKIGLTAKILIRRMAVQIGLGSFCQPVAHVYSPITIIVSINPPTAASMMTIIGMGSSSLSSDVATITHKITYFI